MEEKETKLSNAFKRRVEHAVLNLKEALSEGESEVIRERSEGLKAVVSEK